MPWTEIAIDGLPASDMSGNVTLYEIYDANAETPAVILTGRFNDAWMYGLSATHWKLWEPSADPTVAPELWTDVETSPGPDSPPVVFCEIFDGTSTGTTARAYGQWILPVDPPITVTHWKLPTLSDPPA